MPGPLNDDEIDGLLSGDTKYVTIIKWADGDIKIDYDSQLVEDDEVQLMLFDACRIQQEYRWEEHDDDGTEDVE